MNLTNTSSSQPVSEDYSFMLATAAIELILSFPLNSYVMWLILRGSRESIASDFFYLNLAISETFFSLSGVWILLSQQLQSYLSPLAYMFSLGLLFTARPLFQCCICVECYVGVVHPLIFLRLKPLRYRLACCCVIWLIILLSCIYHLFTFLNNLYLYAYFIQCVGLFSVMLFCCLSVLWSLKRPGPGDKERGKEKSNAMKRKAFNIILLVMVCMTTNFVLYLVAIPLQCCLKIEFDKIFSIFTDIASTTGFIQPLLYLHRSGKLSFTGKV